MNTILSENMLDVNANGEWGQEVLLDALHEHFRTMVRIALQEAMRHEIEEFLGYKPYERSENANSRNGYLPERDLETRFGTIENISVPRDRKGEFQSKIILRYKRREEKIDRQIVALFIGGISTRKMKQITKELFGRGYSQGTISNINKGLTIAMRDWMEEAIDDDIEYAFIDGLNLPVKRYTVSKESLLMVVGINKEGYRRILGVQLGDRESASCWSEFFKDLKQRGFKGEHLKLGVMDGLPGLEKAFSEAFPKARVQRCIVHKLRNVAAKLPRKIQKDCLEHLKRVFYSKSKDAADKGFKEWKEHWSKISPSAVRCVEKDIETLLEFMKEPKYLWKGLRTTNVIERAFKEFRRRTRQMDSLPNEDCCLRCIFALSAEMNARWAHRKVDGYGKKELAAHLVA